MVGVQHGVGVFARALEAGVGGLGVGGNLPLGVVVGGLGFGVVGGFDEAQLLAGYGCRSGYFAGKDADVARAGSTVCAGSGFGGTCSGTSSAGSAVRAGASSASRVRAGSCAHTGGTSSAGSTVRAGSGFGGTCSGTSAASGASRVK